MHTSVSLAQVHDIPDLVLLLDELFSQDIEFTPNHEIQQKGLNLIINNPEVGEIIVLRYNEKIIGMVSLLYSISTALGGKVATLEDMIITRQYQGRKYGSKLLNAALEIADKRLCLRVTLLTDYNNNRAIAFYKKFGFNKSAMIPMRKLSLKN